MKNPDSRKKKKQKEKKKGFFKKKTMLEGLRRKVVTSTAVAAQEAVQKPTVDEHDAQIWVKLITQEIQAAAEAGKTSYTLEFRAETDNVYTQAVKISVPGNLKPCNNSKVYEEPITEPCRDACVLGSYSKVRPKKDGKMWVISTGDVLIYEPFEPCNIFPGLGFWWRDTRLAIKKLNESARKIAQELLEQYRAEALANVCTFWNAQSDVPVSYSPKITRSRGRGRSKMILGSYSTTKQRSAAVPRPKHGNK